MLSGGPQAILRCDQCNKPFDKQSTLKRHGYYCRSRRITATARVRSCLSCAKRKVRCDICQPACSRCTTIGIECQYPTGTLKAAGRHATQSADAPIQGRETVADPWAEFSQTQFCQRTTTDSSQLIEEALFTPDPDVANIEEQLIDSSGLKLDFTEFLNLQPSDEGVWVPSLSPKSLIHPSMPSCNHAVQEQQNDRVRNITIPPTPSRNVRSIIQRPKAKAGDRRTATLILHTLKSYPLMILRHNTLPPFIHNQSVTCDSDNKDNESLTNCIGLVHLLGRGNQSIRELFWRNVRLECERICASVEHVLVSRTELFSALQALSIYVLIRMGEGETEHNDFDTLLLAAVTVIAKQINRSNVALDPQAVASSRDLRTRWRNWIFEETAVRMCLIYQIVDMLVYFEPAAMCTMETHLVLNQLPAKKQLWGARDELAWRIELGRDSGTQPAYGLAASGDLIKLHEVQFHSDDGAMSYTSHSPRANSGADWDEWCSGMDEFGGLIMLAASLVG